MKVNLQISRG